MQKRTAAREVWRPHVTVACVVARDDRYLMVEEVINGVSTYNQPAGHLEDEETLPAAAVRETLEETGWNVALTSLVAIQQWRSTEHGDMVLRFCFAAQPLSHEDTRPLDADITRALWLTRTEIAALGDRLRSPLVLRGIDAWLGGQRLPLDTLEYLPEDRAT